jgi:hypothetical protein
MKRFLSLIALDFSPIDYPQVFSVIFLSFSMFVL